MQMHSQRTESKPLTIEDYQQLRERFKSARPEVVGIVCKPSLELIIRAKIIEQDQSPFSQGGLVGIDICTDADQEEGILTFSDRELMRKYLNRKRDPKAWIEALLRDKIGAEAFDRIFPDGWPDGESLPL